MSEEPAPAPAPDSGDPMEESEQGEDHREGPPGYDLDEQEAIDQRREEGEGGE